MITRRNILTGCIAVLCANAITAGSASGRTLYWKRHKVYGPVACITRPLYEISIVSDRCDGHFYYVTGRVVNHTSAVEIIPPLRRWMDSYLDPECRCTPGFDCGIHREYKLNVSIAEMELTNRDLGIFIAKYNSIL